MDIPRRVEEVLEKFVAAEYAYFTPRGAPLCWPVTPYWYRKRGVLGIATGLAYPNKAEYTRKSPKVSFLFSDPAFSGIEGAPEVLLQGEARLLDQDIQANTDRYVRELRHRFLAARIAINPLTVRLLDFYLPRLWVEVAPLRIIIREGGNETVLGPPLPEIADSEGEIPRRRPSREELEALGRWVARTTAVLTMKGGDGYPYQLRTRTEMTDEGTVRLARAPAVGPAALTLHYLSLGGVRFDALMARGEVQGSDGNKVFLPHRVVGTFERPAEHTLPLLGIFPISLIPRVVSLRRRLRVELERRGAPMPKLRIP